MGCLPERLELRGLGGRFDLVYEQSPGGLRMEVTESAGGPAEGVELLKRCHGALDAHRKRVEELSGEAEATLEPLRDDPDFGGAGGSADA